MAYAPNYYGSSTVLVSSSSLGQTGSLIRIVRGADYKTVNSRQLSFAFPAISNIAVPASATTRLIFTKRDDATETLTKSGTLTLSSASTHTASFDIDGDDTVGMELGDYEYRVEVVDDSANVIVPIFSDKQRLCRLIDN